MAPLPTCCLHLEFKEACLLVSRIAFVVVRCFATRVGQARFHLFFFALFYSAQLSGSCCDGAVGVESLERPNFLCSLKMSSLTCWHLDASLLRVTSRRFEPADGGS